jgi:hypothetical protein
MIAKIFYNPKTLQIIGMTDGEISFSAYPHIEQEFEVYPHATNNFEIIDNNGIITLKINEIYPESVNIN